MQAILWTQADCPLCERVKHALGEGKYEERAAEDLLGANAPDDDALAQLAMQDWQLPLILLDGTFVEPETFLASHDTEAA